jgi:hypothetical protein
MASNATRVRQRAQAVNRLVAAAESATTATGVDAVEIPTHHREPDYLQTLQIEAAANLLERIAGSAAPAETDAAEDDDATAPAPAAKGASTPADAQKRPTRARTGTKD